MKTYPHIHENAVSTVDRLEVCCVCTIDCSKDVATISDCVGTRGRMSSLSGSMLGSFRESNSTTSKRSPRTLLMPSTWAYNSAHACIRLRAANTWPTDGYICVTNAVTSPEWRPKHSSVNFVALVHGGNARAISLGRRNVGACKPGTLDCNEANLLVGGHCSHVASRVFGFIVPEYSERSCAITQTLSAWTSKLYRNVQARRKKAISESKNRCIELRRRPARSTSTTASSSSQTITVSFRVRPTWSSALPHLVRIANCRTTSHHFSSCNVTTTTHNVRRAQGPRDVWERSKQASKQASKCVASFSGLGSFRESRFAVRRRVHRIRWMTDEC